MLHLIRVFDSLLLKFVFLRVDILHRVLFDALISLWACIAWGFSVARNESTIFTFQNFVKRSSLNLNNQNELWVRKKRKVFVTWSLLDLIWKVSWRYKKCLLKDMFCNNLTINCWIIGNLIDCLYHLYCIKQCWSLTWSSKSFGIL